MRLWAFIGVFLALSGPAIAADPSSSTMTISPGNGPVTLNVIEMDCHYDVARSKTVCVTPRGQLEAGTWDTFRRHASFKPEPGFTLTGQCANNDFYGREGHHVICSSVTPKAITCEWYAAGSKRLFGPGGYVNGRCVAYAKSDNAPSRKKRKN